MTALVGLLALIPAWTDADPTLDDVLQKGFKDAQFSIVVVQADQRELAKINKDFGASYRFKTSEATIKEPFKLRLSGKVDDTEILFIVNGTTQWIRVPRANISQKNELAKSPGKRQTMMDFGVLTPSLFDELFSAKFVRVDRATGDYVFDLTFQKPKYVDTTRFRLWIDPKLRYTKRREWYNRVGELMATFLYERPVTQGGATLPTKVTVRNVDGKLAGVTEYRSVAINRGLSDSLFSP